MLVEIGHDGSGGGSGSTVTYARFPDEAYSHAPVDDLTVEQLKGHLYERRLSSVTHLPGYEAFLAIVHDGGVLAAQKVDTPRWVRCDDPALESLLADFLGASTGAPDDLEATHWTYHDQLYPPGAKPSPDAGIVALFNNGGRDSVAANLWSALGASTVLGQTGTATATASGSLTGGTESPGGSHGSNDAVGQMIVAWSNGAYGIVTANTSGTSPVYTVDRWYTPGSPGGSAAATPSSTTGYTLVPGGPPLLFMALSANSSAPALGDTTLTGEITTASGGLIAKICVMSHTAGTNVVTATAVFTANGSDTLPVVIAKIGIGASITSAVKRGVQSLLTATATLNVPSDQVTVSDTITGP